MSDLRRAGSFALLVWALSGAAAWLTSLFGKPWPSLTMNWAAITVIIGLVALLPTVRIDWRFSLLTLGLVFAMAAATFASPMVGEMLGAFLEPGR